MSESRLKIFFKCSVLDVLTFSEYNGLAEIDETQNYSDMLVNKYQCLILKQR